MDLIAATRAEGGLVWDQTSFDSNIFLYPKICCAKKYCCSCFFVVVVAALVNVDVVFVDPKNLPLKLGQNRVSGWWWWVVVLVVMVGGAVKSFSWQTQLIGCHP